MSARRQWLEALAGASVVAIFGAGGFYVVASSSHAQTDENQKTIEQIGDLLKRQADCRKVCAGLSRDGRVGYVDCLRDYCELEPDEEEQPE